MKNDQTSLISNFENLSLNSIKVYKANDIVTFNEIKNKLCKLKNIKKVLKSSSSISEDLSDESKESESEEDVLQESEEDIKAGRLFVGIVDINKYENDAKNLYNKLLKEGNNFKTEFWNNILSENTKSFQIKSPNSIEDLKAIEKFHEEITSKLEDFNEYFPRNQYFKPHTANAKRFLNNAEFINIQLKNPDVDIECISQFLKIDDKAFRKLLKYYSYPREQSINKFKKKCLDKAKFDFEIAEVLKSYLNAKIGRWITTRMMRDHLLNVFKKRINDQSEENFKLSTLNPFNIRRILRVYLDYTWRKCKQRAKKLIGIQADKRKLFEGIIKNLKSIGFNIIYVDEWSVWPQNLSLYSWCHKYKPDPLIRPSKRINMIAALISPNKYEIMLKTGSTTSHHIIFFFELLNQKLCDLYGNDYISSTVIVLDNASIHLSESWSSYFKFKKLSILTLPPYSPELNDVEQVFKRLKTDLSICDFSKKRLEYIVAESIIKMK